MKKYEIQKWTDWCDSKSIYEAESEEEASLKFIKDAGFVTLERFEEICDEMGWDSEIVWKEV